MIVGWYFSEYASWTADVIIILLSLQQRNPLSSTYRRLGEELYKPTVVRFAGIEEDVKILDGLHEKPKAAVFFRSPNLHIRLLSCLIIMKTLSQGTCEIAVMSNYHEDTLSRYVWDCCHV